MQEFLRPLTYPVEIPLIVLALLNAFWWVVGYFSYYFYLKDKEKRDRKR